MWTSTPSSTRITRTPSPSLAKRFTSTASICATRQHRKQKAKSSAAMTTGKNACPHCWLTTASTNSKGPTVCSTNSCFTSTSMKPIVNSASPRTRPKLKPWPKNVPFCGPSRLVLGGRLSGASNPASASATTAKSPPAPNVRPLRLHRAPSLFAAYARMVTAITSVTSPIQKPNPLSPPPCSGLLITCVLLIAHKSLLLKTTRQQLQLNLRDRQKKFRSEEH